MIHLLHSNNCNIPELRNIVAIVFDNNGTDANRNALNIRTTAV